MNVTEKQMEAARFVWRYRKANGIAPTLQEIADHMRVARVTAFEHVKLMQKKGVLSKSSGSRNISLSRALAAEIERTEKPRACPHCGGAL